MKAMIKTVARLAAVVVLSTATILTHTSGSYAAGPRPLTAADFFPAGAVGDLTTNPGHVAGTTYSKGIELGNCPPIAVSFNMQHYPGYNAFSALFGVDDGSVGGSSRIQLSFYGDDRRIFTITMSQGQLARRIVVQLGKATVIRIVAQQVSQGCNWYAILANPVLLPAGAPATTTPPATASVQLSLRFLAATASAGGQQAALVVTAGNASVGMIIDYPDGTQVLVGPKRAGADGHLVYTWTVPSGVPGTVHVTVDSAGRVAQGTFSVS